MQDCVRWPLLGLGWGRVNIQSHDLLDWYRCLWPSVCLIYSHIILTSVWNLFKSMAASNLALLTSRCPLTQTFATPTILDMPRQRIISCSLRGHLADIPFNDSQSSKAFDVLLSCIKLDIAPLVQMKAFTTESFNNWVGITPQTHPDKMRTLERSYKAWAMKFWILKGLWLQLMKEILDRDRKKAAEREAEKKALAKGASMAKEEEKSTEAVTSDSKASAWALVSCRLTDYQHPQLLQISLKG